MRHLALIMLTSEPALPNNKDCTDFITALDGGTFLLVIGAGWQGSAGEGAICQDDQGGSELITGRDNETAGWRETGRNPPTC